jgi:hypothetical protein
VRGNNEMRTGFIVRSSAIAIVAAIALSACSSAGSSSTAAPTAAPVTGGNGSGSGTGSGTGASPAAGAPAACTLLALNDVSTLLGEPAAAPEGGLNVTGEDESNCDWQQVNTSAGVLHLVQLQVFNSPRYLKRTGYQPNQIISDVSIPGTSEAFAIDEGNGIGINMLVGATRAVLHYTPGGKADPKPTLPALTVLATKLAGALPR